MVRIDVVLFLSTGPDLKKMTEGCGVSPPPSKINEKKKKKKRKKERKKKTLCYINYRKNKFKLRLRHFMSFCQMKC